MKRGERRNLIDLSVRALLWAAVVFLAVPAAYDALTSRGPTLVLHNNFAPLYVLALLVVFVVWRKDALLRRPLLWHWHEAALYGGPALFLFALSMMTSYRDPTQASNAVKALYVIMPQLLNAIASLLLAISIFGMDLFRREKQAVIVGTLVGIPYVSLSLLLRQFWPYLSDTVLWAEARLLGLTGGMVHVITLNSPTLSLENFTVVIGEACSGVDSAIMFSGVYLFVTLLDWPRMDKRRLALLFPLGLAGMFCMNILRVGLLMVVGAYWSPDFALSLFHENAGWILFVAYTLGFWHLAYPHLCRRRRPSHARH